MSTEIPDTVDTPTGKTPQPPEEAPVLDVHALKDAVGTISREYEGMVPEETIERVVFESYATLYRSAKVKTHLAALAQHYAEGRVRALAIARGAIASPVPQVLFLCPDNAGRSQIASALLTHHAGGEVEVRSAGMSPAHGVDSQVARELEARGVAMTRAFSKPVTDDIIRVSDYVVTMGDVDMGPVYSDKNVLDWEVADPQGASEDGVREIVDDVDTRVRGPWEEIRSRFEEVPPTVMADSE